MDPRWLLAQFAEARSRRTGGEGKTGGRLVTAITVRDLFAEATQTLTLPHPSLSAGGGDGGQANPEAPREAELLLAHALGRDRAWLIAHRDDAVAPALAGQVRCCVSRRAAGEPIAYIVGRRGFHAIELALTPDVLIPRAETELLVELALQRIAQSVKVDIVDLGTGSGAIALALAQARPQAQVLATDASVAALAVARGNALRLGIGNVEFAQGDWCAALGKRRFDLIVSNPPYIAEDDAHLVQGDLRFEPRAALASGADGLDAIRAIVRAAPTHLRDGGWLLLEHGADQGEAVRELLQHSGFVEVSTSRDLEQRERVSGGKATKSGLR
jgi:release factor glutamine methyltransferase